MNADNKIIKALGAAQLAVFAASMLSERLLTSTVGPGSMSEKLVNVSNSRLLIRISNLVALANCLGIVVLGALFYVALSKQSKIISLLALGCYLAEAITLAVSKIGAYALIPLSQQFVEAGSPDPSFYQALGDLLYSGIDRVGYDIHMLFFCLGAILWYYLLYRSESIPRTLSVWGLAAVGALAIPVLLVLYDRSFDSLMLLGLPYAPYELVLGIWLMAKGFNEPAIESASTEARRS
jgi:hypothetical protein